MKGEFLTGHAIIRQLDKKGMYRVCSNELYKDEDESIYLVWRLFETDNYTWINSADWDIRCSHLHDVGCKYHQIVKVKLTEEQLVNEGYLRPTPLRDFDELYCKDIPSKYLEIVDVSGHQINNLFFRMLKASNAPKTIQWLYRAGVAFNLNWFFAGKQKIDLNRIYDEDWNKE